jgi:hypothetical protein
MPGIMAWLGLNISGFTSGLNQAKGVARTSGSGIAKELSSEIGNKLKQIGSVAAVTAGIKSAMDYADKIGDIASRLGVSSEAAQVWDQALQLNGSSIEAFVPVMERFAQSRQKAIDGDENMISTFARMGVSMDQLKSKVANEDLFAQVGRMFETGDPQKLIVDFRELGGKGAGAMVAAFRDGMGEMVQANRDSLSVMSSETVASLKTTGDTFKSLWTEIRAGIGTVSAKPLAIAASAVDKTKEMLATISRYAGGFSVGGFAGGKSAALDYLSELDKQRDKPKDNKTPAATLALDEEAHNTKELNSLWDKLTDKQRQNRLEQMTSAEKMLMLEQRRAELQEKLKNSKTEKSALETGIELAEVEKEIWGAGKSFTAEQGKTGKMFRNDLNSLQQIGSYAAMGPEVAALDISRKQERHLDQINKNIAKLAGQGSGGTAGVSY